MDPGLDPELDQGPADPAPDMELNPVPDPQLDPGPDPECGPRD